MAEENYLVKIETTQPNNFRSLFNILKENNIPEVNINITPNGLEILEMDTSRSVIAYVSLLANKFDSYYCRKPIKIGVDVGNLTKIMKGIGNKEILTMFVEDPAEQLKRGETDDSGIGLLFGLLIENQSKGQSSTVQIRTVDVNDHHMAIPELDYPYYIQMPSADLQSIITNLKNMGGETIKILFHKDSLQFYTVSELGVLTTNRSKTIKEDSSIKIKQNDKSSDESRIVELYLKLDGLTEFAKCSCLSPIVTMYLKNDFPLFLEYDVGSLGSIRLGLSPGAKPDDF